MIWISIIISGLITYLIRASTLAFIKRDMLGDEIRTVLSYVPSAIFPAIIFPAVFFNDNLSFVEIDNPKILAALGAIIVGYLFKNVIATILTGIIIYWFFLL